MNAVLPHKNGNSTPSQQGSYPLAGADGRDVVIPLGEWYRNTKARARRMMQNSLSSNARRVYACLELATMGYSQELAVTMDGGKTRPLLSADIMRQTGLKRQYIDVAFDELEAAGLAERRPINPDIPLQKGNIALYSWGVPRQPKATDCHARHDKNPDWMPGTWADSDSPVYKILKRFKLQPSPDFLPARDYISEVETVARDYKETEDRLVALLRSSCAGSSAAEPSLLVEKNGKENNNNRESAPSPEPAQSVVVAQNGNAEVHLNREGSLVLEALQQYGTTTEQAAGKLIAECRKANPDCTSAEIVETIAILAAGFSAGRTRNPVGVLLTQVPGALVRRPPPDLNELRHRMMSSTSTDRIAAAESILANPNATPDDRLDAQEVLSWARGLP